MDAETRRLLDWSDTLMKWSQESAERDRLLLEWLLAVCERSEELIRTARRGAPAVDLSLLPQTLLITPKM